MENNENENRSKKMMKKTALQKTFDKILLASCCFGFIGLVNAVLDWIKGDSVDWLQTLFFVFVGLSFLLVYAIINYIVNHAKRYASLNDEEKDVKKEQFCFLTILAIITMIFIILAILSR